MTSFSIISQVGHSVGLHFLFVQSHMLFVFLKLTASIVTVPEFSLLVGFGRFLKKRCDHWFHFGLLVNAKTATTKTAT